MTMVENSPKRHRASGNGPESKPARCNFYIEQKKRYCSMQRKKDHQYCSEHLAHESSDLQAQEEERVPCPLDPKHTVRAKLLKTHLKKCPSRPSQNHPAWYVENLNHTLRNTEHEVNRDDKPPKSLEQVIELLSEYKTKTSPLEKHIRSHPGLDNYMEGKENRKHIVQQASLVGNLQDSGLLSTEKYYVEFGCGKAELSRTVNACILHDRATDNDTASTNYGFGLIDRGSNRMKMDSKIISACKDAGLESQLKRDRIDIAHLDLDEFLRSEHHSGVVAISKHLCGVATDLTLKSIFNSKQTLSRFSGLVVAMCCRHVCDYGQLLPQSQEYLAQQGIGPSDFAQLKKIVSWATCGYTPEKSHESGLDYDERLAVGLAARRMIDESRVYAINQLFKGYKAELFLYAERDITLENHCLRISRS